MSVGPRGRSDGTAGYDLSKEVEIVRDALGHIVDVRVNGRRCEFTVIDELPSTDIARREVLHIQRLPR